MDSSNPKKKKRSKVLIVLIILVVLAVGVFFIFFRQKPTASSNTTVTRTVTLTKTSFQNAISAEGKVASQSSTNVTTTLNYKVDSIAVEVGDYVNVGDTIATLDTSEIQKKITREQESIAEKKEQLEKDVQNAYDGKEDAWYSYAKVKDTGSEEEHKQERNFASANGKYFEAVEALEKGPDTSSLEDYYEELNNCTIKAESAGTITSLNATVGSSAANTTIATISDINNLEVTVTVDEYDIQDIEKGMKAVVSTDAVDGSFDATVTAVSLAATTSTTGQTSSTGFEVKVTLDDSTDALLIGMNVKVNIILEEQNDVYTVPIDAVETDESGNSVIYVQQDDGTFDTVNVTKGKTSDYYVVISDDCLKDGMVVRASANESEAEMTIDSSDFDGDIQFDMGGGGGGNAPMDMPGGGQ